MFGHCRTRPSSGAGRDPRGLAFLADPAAWIDRDVLLIGRPETLARGIEAVRPLFSRIEHLAPLAVMLGDVKLY